MANRSFNGGEVRISMPTNFDQKVIDDFGSEWEAFTQSELELEERRIEFQNYFEIFPWDDLPADSVGADIGCGSGRWALLAAPRVGHLHCVDPSSAIEIAKENLQALDNVSFHRTRIDDMPVPDDSLDFAYVLGVLHHLPDPKAGLADCVRKLKPGAPLLAYIYYRFDNQPAWFRMIWQVSDRLRRIIAWLPKPVRFITTQIIAACVYFPLARLSLLLEKLGMNVKSVPLSHYRNKSFYTMRTDALDRFGTRLEHRFTRAEITDIMEECGLTDIRFSDTPPFWGVVGRKKAEPD